jgi:anti-sigma B factor antagonist
LHASLDPSVPPDLHVAVDDRGATRTITPHGEIDLWTVGGVQRALESGLAGRFETVVLDLVAAEFIDSTGVAALLAAAQQARAGAVRLVLLPGPPDVQRVFEICGLMDVLPFTGNGTNRESRS